MRISHKVIVLGDIATLQYEAGEKNIWAMATFQLAEKKAHALPTPSEKGNAMMDVVRETLCSKAV